MPIQPEDEDGNRPKKDRGFPVGMGVRAGSFMGALKGTGINLDRAKSKTYMKAAQMRLRKRG